MTTEEFEVILDQCCELLTTEARSKGFSSAKHFENRVREVLSNLTAGDTSFEIDEDGNLNLASSVSRPYKEGKNYEK